MFVLQKPLPLITQKNIRMMRGLWCLIFPEAKTMKTETVVEQKVAPLFLAQRFHKHHNKEPFILERRRIGPALNFRKEPRDKLDSPPQKSSWAKHVAFQDPPPLDSPQAWS